MKLSERLHRLLPDRCRVPGCARLGVRGNENVIGGVIMCDGCHLDMIDALTEIEIARVAGHERQ